MDSGLRSEVRKKYAKVASEPTKEFHFHTGRRMADMLGYPDDILDRLPPQVIESFAGVGNPFSIGTIEPGETVIDIGSGSGFDCIIAAQYTGEGGRVIGVEMTQDMLDKANRNRQKMGLDNVEFRSGYAENIPVEDRWADVAISNGVINLCPDKERVFREIFRVLRTGGRLLLADIVTRKPDAPIDVKECCGIRLSSVGRRRPRERHSV